MTVYPHPGSGSRRRRPRRGRRRAATADGAAGPRAGLAAAPRGYSTVPK